jgi:50S ribosomal protein L16 3-hydroxylase
VTADQRLFNGLTLRRFLQRHWQREPLLVRDAWRSLAGSGRTQADEDDLADLPTDPQGLITTRSLFALARDPDVESRLVLGPAGVPPASAGAAARPSRPAGGWRLRHGPFNRLPSRRQPGWSLLVQGVDLRLPAARALMDRFRFLPDARLDDLMVSFATDGGGVGPHVDSYDVFLLQVAGRRRWQISAPGAGALVPDAPLRLLADFKAEQTWVLEPGDMLYLPPGWGHEGTAVGDCITCSIGFRSPSRSELRQAFFGYLADLPAAASRPAPPNELNAPDAPNDSRTEPRYRDRIKAPVAHPAEIPDDMARTLAAWVRGYRPTAQMIDRFIGCYLTEPKPSVWFDRPGHPEDEDDDSRGGSATVAPGTSIVLDLKTRMLYRGRNFYINGEAVDVPPKNRQAHRLLTVLADRRGLDADQTDQAFRDGWLGERLTEWLASGWLR